MVAVSRPGATTEDDVGVEIGSTLLGKYRIEAVLGRGGMGIVARATHLHLDEQVAIKFLRRDAASDPEAAQRFLREAQAAVKLKSEHVARVIDVGTLDGQVPYLVMEYLQGSDLDQMLEQSGTVSPELAVDFIMQACEALSEAHSLGIIHRDIKPSNVFVTWRSDGSVLVKVLDFGISKVQTALTEMSLTQTQSVLGTPAYMSPEQMRSARNVDARTDIWSLGTVLYELVQGHRPFEAQSFSEMCVKVAVDEPMPMTMPMPPGLSDVIMKCLAKAPGERFANVGELAQALVPYARDPRAAQLLSERIRRTVGRTAPRPVADHGSGPIAIPRVPHHTTERTPPPPALAVGGMIGRGAMQTPMPGRPPAATPMPGAQFPRPDTPSGLHPQPSAGGSVPGWNAEESWNVPPTGVSHVPAPRVSASMGAVGRRLWLSVIVAVLTVGAALVVFRGTESRAKDAGTQPAMGPAAAVDAATAVVDDPIVPAAPVDAGTAEAVTAVDVAVAPVVSPPDAGAAATSIKPTPGAGSGTGKRPGDRRDRRDRRGGDKRGSGAGTARDDDIFGNRK